MLTPLAILRELRGPLGILASMQFISSVGIGVMLPIIPLYAISLGAAPRDLGLLTTAFSLAFTASTLAAGFLIDRFEPRLILRGGIAAYAGANVLIASATSTFALGAFRSMAGFGAGANVVADRVYLSFIAEPKKLALLNGIMASAMSSGQVLGPAVGGVLAQFGDLSVPFLVVGATSSIAFLASLTLPAAKVRAPQPLDEATPLSAMNRSVIILLLASMLSQTAFGGFITTYAVFASSNLSWSTLEVGLIFSIFAAGSIIIAPPLSQLADQHGRRLFGMFSTLPLGLFGIAMVLELPRPVMYATAFLGGGGLTLFTACWFALLTTASPEARRGRTFGVVSAFASLGLVIGANGSALIWEFWGVAMGLLVAALVGSTAGLVLTFLPKTPRPARIDPVPAQIEDLRT